LVALSNYDDFGTLGRMGFFAGRFIKSQFARLQSCPALPPLSAGASRRSASRAWLAERINVLVQPKIRLT
jgi:NADH dehydrogenase